MVTDSQHGVRAGPRLGLRFCAAAVLLGLAGFAAYYAYYLNHAVEDQPAPPAPMAHGSSWFRDMTAESGVDFTYRNGEEADQFAILESLGGGVALLDFDRDGLLEIFVTGGGQFAGANNRTIQGRPCKLYRNLGGWKFLDVTAAAGLDIPWWYTHGAAVSDYDRDGWPDLVVTGYGRLALFHNEPDGKQGRRFVDVSNQLGLRDDAWSTSAGWADLDGDGFPELYVCHYVDWSFDNHPSCRGNAAAISRDVCPPERFTPLVHALFHNEKGRAFRNSAAEHGFRATGCGLGVVLTDLNGDGRPDMYVANDTNDNYLFLNRGGKFEEKGLVAGVARDEAGRSNGSMGADAADFDGSGRPSLWVTNYQNELHALYRNLGRELFHFQSRAAGIGALGNSFVGFGTSFVDFDNDGWEDLVIAHGHVLRFPIGGQSKQPPGLLRNVEFQGRRFFKDASQQGGSYFRAPQLGRGLAIGDLDNDGWPDLVVSHSNSPMALLRNEGSAQSGARWLGVRLMGRDHRDVVGSTVILESNRRKLTRFAKGGGSYLSANDPRIVFGLHEDEQVARVTVQWAWGATEVWDALVPLDYWELHEGQAAAGK